MPKYLKLFKESDTIFEEIERNILDKNAFLYEEPHFILQNEVTEPMRYFTILETIANGEHKLGNIAGKLNKNVQNITSFIIGECKYSNKKVGIDILEQLETKSKKIELKLPVKYYLLFSKSGFTKDLIEIEKNREDIILIDKFL